MNNINELSFEQAYQALNEVVAKLESGELPLDEAVQLYEQGRLLSARCQQLLDSAQLRIKQLDEDGSQADYAS